MLYHCRNHSWQQFAAELQTWISVDFDEFDPICTVYHEIQSQYLKVVLKTLWIQFQISCLYSIKTDLHHPRIHRFDKTELTVRMIWIHIPLKLTVWHLVTLLIFTILLRVFLYSVVGQMHHLIIKLIDVIIMWWGANISLTEPICSHTTV